MRRHARIALALALALALAAAALAGCGGDAGDLLTITTSGGGGDNHRYLVTGDGRGSCDGAADKTLPSDHVLDAREVEREAVDAAKKRSSFVTGSAPGARRYVLATKDGIVTWTEGARGAPSFVAKGIVLAQELKHDLCAGSESQGP
jgi:hypothetical protein